MNNSFLTLTVKDRIGTLTLNHPPSNLLSTSMLIELDRAFDKIEADPTIKTIILMASGRFFCLGADIQELSEIQTAQQGRAFSARGQNLLNRIERLDKPVIAAINGACLGGGLELAMACHIRFAAKEASLGLPEIKLGLIPGFGGTQRLPWMIGASKATELILTGSILSPDDAMVLGLVNEVLPASDLLSRAQTLAEIVTGKGSPAVRSALSAIRTGRDRVSGEGFTREAELFGQLCETRDAKEGIKAFLKKRLPHFQDQ